MNPSGIRKIRLTLTQQKALADKSILQFHSGDLKLKSITSLELVGYSTSGTSGTVPDHVLAVFNNIYGGGGEFVAVTNGTVSMDFDQNIAHAVLYPPGGAQTQSRLHASIGDTETTLKMQNASIELRSWNAASGQYERWDDYTSCVLEFVAYSFEYTTGVRRTIKK